MKRLLPVLVGTWALLLVAPGVRSEPDVRGGALGAEVRSGAQDVGPGLGDVGPGGRSEPDGRGGASGAEVRSGAQDVGPGLGDVGPGVRSAPDGRGGASGAEVRSGAQDVGPRPGGVGPGLGGVGPGFGDVGPGLGDVGPTAQDAGPGLGDVGPGADGSALGPWVFREAGPWGWQTRTGPNGDPAQGAGHDGNDTKGGSSIGDPTKDGGCACSCAPCPSIGASATLGGAPSPGPSAPAHAITETNPTLSTADAVRAIFGLVLLLALAYIGGHPRMQRLEQRLRISQVITAGFPFVILGLISRDGMLGVLSEPVLDAIRPLLPLGLGWIGFAVGFRFDVRKLERMPPLSGEAFVATTAIPYVFILVATAGFLYLSGGDAAVLAVRDAFVLASAGAMTAIALPRLLAQRGADEVDIERVDRIIQLEELAALLGILIIGAFFRPEDTGAGWHMPSVGWVFVTIGIGAALSAVIFAMLGTIKGPAETLIVMLGSISFAAGMASFLRISPVVVCFIAGAALRNFPGGWKTQVYRALTRIERPIYLLFLVIAGALWHVDEWQGWVMMVIFVAARLFGRTLGVGLFARRHPTELTRFELRHLAVSPMGALSIAIVVTAQDLYSGKTVPWLVNAVIGGAILTEFIVQIFAFDRPRPKPEGDDVYRGEFDEDFSEAAEDYPEPEEPVSPPPPLPPLPPLPWLADDDDDEGTSPPAGEGEGGGARASVARREPGDAHGSRQADRTIGAAPAKVAETVGGAQQRVNIEGLETHESETSSGENVNVRRRDGAIDSGSIAVPTTASEVSGGAEDDVNLSDTETSESDNGIVGNVNDGSRRVAHQPERTGASTTDPAEPEDEA